MNSRLAHLLTRLYPRAWRERYGDEFEAFLEDTQGDLRSSFNVTRGAVREHISPTRGGTMHRDPRTFGAMVRRPSAFLPLAMSLIALSVVLGSIAIFGVVREPDEGACAHIWQLLMAGQLPVLAFFAVKWLPRAPRAAWPVLGLQAMAALASIAPVYFLNL